MDGKKFDTGKLAWFDLPMELVELLVPVATAGRETYGLHSALLPLDNGMERWYSAKMRHTTECQRNPLAIDPTDGCYHLAKSAYNDLARLYQALQAQKNEEDKE